MGRRKVIVLESVRTSIAEASWYMESKGFIATADKFADAVYNFIERLSNPNISYKICTEPERALHGLRCIQFRKYTFLGDKRANWNFMYLCFKLKTILILALFDVRQNSTTKPK